MPACVFDQSQRQSPGLASTKTAVSCGSGMVDRRATVRRRGVWLALVVLLAVPALGCGAEEIGIERDEGDPAVSQDGWLAFASRGAVYVARPGRAATRITEPGGGIDGSPDWSPNGSRLVFARSSEDGAQGIYVVGRNGRGLRRLTRGHDVEPAWSPDGDTIVFEHARGPFALSSSIRAIDADGRRERLLIGDAEDPAWSPDGSRIAFVQGWGATLATFDLRTRRVTRLRRGSLVAAPAWSPDGRWIAFVDWDDVPSESAYVPGIPEIYVVSADGSRPKRLTHNSETDWAPTWTRDGRVLFASFRGGPSRLYVMNRDGTRLRPVR